MSDLISRSELLESFRKSYCGHLGMENSDGMITFRSICRIINEQQTAYDVGKIVEELESFAKLAEDRWTNGTSKYACQEHKCWVKAIEIVKQGGVSDDVCEWKKSKDYPFDWLVGCDGCEVNHRQGDYCPRCGKKIKAV